MPNSPTTAIPLTSAQKKYLRGLAMKLKPKAAIGKNGLTESCLKELKAALEREELVKVKIPGKANERKLLAQQTETATQSALIGTIGSTATFYQPHQNPEKNQIKLP